MSLIRQVWLLLLALMLAALLGSAAVSALSMRQLMQTQLQLKNNDNAAALALAMSQQGGDAQLMELLVSAQFDTGYYQSVTWRRADGSVAFERQAPAKASTAPAWFVALTPIEVPPGSAKVSNGWQAAGAVEVRSQAAYAHDELWAASLRMAVLLAALGLLAAGAAHLALSRIRRPLDNAVAQALAVVQGQYTLVDEPRVPELARLAQAMNAMVAKVRQMFEAQAEQLEVLRRQAHCDALTGLNQRKHFLAELESALNRDDGPARAGLLLLRLRDLEGLNQQLGRGTVDQVLSALGHVVAVYPERVNGCLAGRLNGADFALWLPAPDVAQDTAQALSQALQAGLAGFGSAVQVAMGAVELARERPLSDWFGAADSALARAEARGGFAVEVLSTPADTSIQGERAWRTQILDAIAARQGRLREYPVLDKQGQLLHLECPLQLQLEPQAGYETAARWLPLAQRSRLTAEVDLHATALALEAIAQDGRPRCVNIAPASLLEGGFVARLREQVFHAPQAARKLGLELAESAALQHFELLQEMGRQLRPLGVKLGLEHAGPGLSHVDRLYQAGLDYVKLDAAVVVGVSGDAARAAFVRGMVIMLRSLALKVYAEGVVEALDVQALWDCELDGVTGPWATSQG
ncbi:MAG: LapD/MoxY N-terminal periplasmic domain-containing protein [Roseateles asaccharophilus]|jgi:predicted signal transduction protein with EAL and GGDEF domain|uniref:bifunctional diguanylate cyclase/phosphodiesterase n=1 Tax=Roseateles asaccharophilus TaxID=582607 RepID=UPI00391D576C